MSSSAAETNAPGVAGGTRFYRDPHETSLALTVLGAVLTAAAVAQATTADELGTGWLASMALTLAFAALWLIFRRRAAAGLRHRAGFGAAAIIGLIACITPFALVIAVGGPFRLFALGLLAAGLSMGNRFLTAWAVVVGGLGMLESFYGITNRLPLAIWATWEHSAIYLALSALTLAAGVYLRRRGEPPGRTQVKDLDAG